ncbi:hypothetical protein HUK65_17160 [Rhodobacteraceae bacterium 2376]|uniref:Uncharacterized protein n=1 Tax=Rhabdonatronobacter sediminivivens TaxID=2743469 RepID=A0A7Z0I2D8_9RHOB|nr:hypothetical protein [Rhabdonatronobacter sediminivivens]NYS26712.1 hypothetical protein [Rhabdonatronobacter sediminivivens]
MTVLLSTCPPPAEHRVIDVVGAVGVSHKTFMQGPDLGVALEACREGLRRRAEELGADMVAGCHFQVDFNASVANVTGFGTAVQLLSGKDA